MRLSSRRFRSMESAACHARVAVGIVLALGAASPSPADYQQAYRTGVTAYSRSRWQETITAMKEAISERANENASAVFIYGTWYEPYVPHYYLGMAFSKLGRCPEAVQALTETKRQKAIPRKYFVNVDQALSRCASALLPSGDPSSVPPSKDPLPDSPGSSLPPVPAPSPPATNTSPQPAGTSQNTARLEASRDSLTTALQRARNLLVLLPKGVVPREAASLKVRIKRAESASSSGSAEEVVAATRNLATAAEDLETWIRTRGAIAEPPRELLTAVEAYLRGDYTASLSVLNGAKFTEVGSLAQAMLFRAAASHALFVIGHSRDKDLQARALGDVRQYKTLERNPSPDARVFSPAFVEFVQQAAGGSRTASSLKPTQTDR